VSVLWWALVVAFAVGCTLSVVAKRPLTKDDWIILPFAAWGLVGALLAWRRPDNPMGWLFLSIGALSGLAGVAATVTTHPGALVAPVAWFVVVCAWYQQWFWFPTFALSTVFTVLLFPDGLPSRRWRPVLWTTITAVAVLSLLAAFNDQLSAAAMPPGSTPVDNPLGSVSLPVLDQGSSSPLFGFAFVVLIGCAGLTTVSAFLRYRRSRGVERLQLRWFVFAVAVSAVVFLVVGVGGAAAQSSASTDVVTSFIASLALAFVPISCGIAILRYHVYDVDRVVSRTTSYALVTALVVAVYAAVVTLVPRLVPVSSSLAVAAATLFAAAFARPALRRVQAVVDRRFNRGKVDAQRTVDAFGARLRDEVDADVVRSDLLGAVDRTLQPATITLWLRA
jgi:hypothetical protein